MRLLIYTQIVDEKDSTLGFFHAWIGALAIKFESIEVVCLQEGEHNLPENVTVHSLGKELLKGNWFIKRMLYIARALRYAWILKGKYNTVFVHMNQEYILISGILWKLLGKPIYMWRNHYDGSFLTDVAAFFCRKIFCTSRFSYTAKYKKTVIMPVGIDTSGLDTLPKLFRKPNSILSIGRVSPSKNIHLLIEALGMVHEQGIDFSADIIGKTEEKDKDYLLSLEERVAELGMEEKVQFHGPLPKTETYKAYRTHEISVNASPSGMLDKTMFSGMMHGCLILVSNKDILGKIPEECSFEEGSTESLAKGLARLLEMPFKEKNKYVEMLKIFVQIHSLDALSLRLVTEFSGAK